MCFFPYEPERCAGLSAQFFEPKGVPFVIQLIKFEPRAEVPFHEHEVDQWFLVMEGKIIDEHAHYPKGSMKFYPKGSRHEVVSPEGALVLYVKKKE